MPVKGSSALSPPDCPALAARDGWFLSPFCLVSSVPPPLTERKDLRLPLLSPSHSGAHGTGLGARRAQHRGPFLRDVVASGCGAVCPPSILSV